MQDIKDSPPYVHDGLCFTLEDAVEYFNLIQQLHLTAQEKEKLVAFLRCLQELSPREDNREEFVPPKDMLAKHCADV